jgi:hypothetical protein
MARGIKGLFGRQLDEPWIWWPLVAVFVIGLSFRYRQERRKPSPPSHF